MTAKTYRDIQQFVVAANAWLSRNEGRKSKFSYALTRNAKRLQPLLTTYQERIEDLSVEHCATDDKGVIQADENGSYRFTKEGAKARLAAIRALNAEPVEFEPYLAPEIPDDLTDAETMAFEGFVLPEDTASNGYRNVEEPVAVT